MDNPLFTIIIPTYNSEKFIATSLTSIITQKCKSFEVLIVDGLSRDDTIKIASSFEDDRIKVFSEKDKGIYDAMNKGIRYAKGQWLYFLGSDDTLFDKDVLNEVRKNIQANKDAKIFYGNVKLKGDAGWAKDGHIYDGFFSIHRIITRNICHQSIFYHKTVFDRMGMYNLEYKICADHDFNIRASRVFKYRFIDIIVANFTGGGKSSSTDELFVKDYDKIVIAHHHNLLYKINISNKTLLAELISTYREGKLWLSVNLFFLFLYKISIQKIFRKFRSYL
ncbi:MAG TPA: glycosyltransferase family 2 protein [Pelobium sp.]|nr:glycosyltransferase family 2 protein [Pelobium sp.]